MFGYLSLAEFASADANKAKSFLPETLIEAKILIAEGM